MTKLCASTFFAFAGNNGRSILSRLGRVSAQEMSSFKFLGIHIELNFKWDIHIDYICKKLYNMSFAIFKLRSRIE